MNRIVFLLLVAALAAAGCRGSRDESARDLEKNLRDSEASGKESRTLAALAKIESSLSDYVKAENKVPKTLDALIPKYLAEIPAVDIGVPGHRDTAEVKVYPMDTLRDGQIDGTKLRDTGKWGYVFTENRVVVFVDCTHSSSHGRPWYLERGVY
ncbi:MAG: hypothetical protein AAB320_02565 [Elusimicrobiota bacterium]